MRTDCIVVEPKPDLTIMPSCLLSRPGEERNSRCTRRVLLASGEPRPHLADEGGQITNGHPEGEENLRQGSNHLRTRSTVSKAGLDQLSDMNLHVRPPTMAAYCVWGPTRTEGILAHKPPRFKQLDELEPRSCYINKRLILKSTSSHVHGMLYIPAYSPALCRSALYGVNRTQNYPPSFAIVTDPSLPGVVGQSRRSPLSSGHLCLMLFVNRTA